MSLSSSEKTPADEGIAVPPDLDAIYRAYAGTVARWVAKLVGPQADVEDLVHEIFLVARRRLPEFRGEAKLTTWLCRITERVARQTRCRERFRRWFSRMRRFEIEDATAPTRLPPVDALERRESKEACYRMLDRLPDKYRTVLILFELEDLSGEDIASLTGLKPATVWVRLHRARSGFLADVRRAQRLRPVARRWWQVRLRHRARALRPRGLPCAIWRRGRRAERSRDLPRQVPGGSWRSTLRFLATSPAEAWSFPAPSRARTTYISSGSSSLSPGKPSHGEARPQSSGSPRSLARQWGKAGKMARRFSVAARSEPGRERISVEARIPEQARESMAKGVLASDA